MYCKRIFSSKMVEVLICVSFSLGVGINLKPLANKLVWSFVRAMFQRFLMCILFASVCAGN